MPLTKTTTALLAAGAASGALLAGTGSNVSADTASIAPREEATASYKMTPQQNTLHSIIAETFMENVATLPNKTSVSLDVTPVGKDTITASTQTTDWSFAAQGGPTGTQAGESFQNMADLRNSLCQSMLSAVTATNLTDGKADAYIEASCDGSGNLTAKHITLDSNEKTANGWTKMLGVGSGL